MEEEREGEKHQCVVASRMPPTGDLAHNPGMCPAWESNQRPFDSQAGAQPLSHTSQDVGIFNRYKHAQGFKEKDGQNEQADGKSQEIWGRVEEWGEKAYNCN